LADEIQPATYLSPCELLDHLSGLECPSGPQPLRMTHRSWWQSPARRQRHLELCALKSLAIRSKPVLHLHTGLQNPRSYAVGLGVPRHRVYRLVVQLFPHRLASMEAAPLADARPDRCAQPLPRRTGQGDYGSLPL